MTQKEDSLISQIVDIIRKHALMFLIALGLIFYIYTSQGTPEPLTPPLNTSILKKII
jgi:hypothetical protein